jgi:copper homeostasis protein
VTPSIGLIEQAATVIGGRDVALHVLIRPRAGGFDYTDDEFDIIQRDIIAAKVAGADGELQQRHFRDYSLFYVNLPIASHAGVVFGALTGDEKIDIPRMKLVRQMSKGMLLTFHRAFDVCAESHAAALETIISIGCDRLLTSGGPQSNATLNIDALKALQQLARGRIEIVVAAGVSEENAAQLLKSTGVSALHAGSAVCKTMSASAAAPASATGAAAAAVASTSTSANAATGQGKHSVRGESPGLESFVAVGAGGDSPTPKGSATLEELRFRTSARADWWRW